jgi:hypothetical protein
LLLALVDVPQASASAASAFLNRTESVDGAQGILAAAERSDEPAAIASRAAATSLSVIRVWNRAILDLAIG